MASGKISKPTSMKVLWSGTAGNGNGITLAESFQNYDYLFITLKANAVNTGYIVDCHELLNDTNNNISGYSLGLEFQNGVYKYQMFISFVFSSNVQCNVTSESNNPNIGLVAKKITGVKFAS